MDQVTKAYSKKKNDKGKMFDYTKLTKNSGWLHLV